MRSEIIIVPVLILALAACVSGAPRLTPEQEGKLASIIAYAPGQTPSGQFTTLGNVSAADCSATSYDSRREHKPTACPE